MAFDWWEMSMPLDSDELDELKASIAVAKKRDLNFAVCLGKKPEGTVMLTHRMKGPDILGKQAKRSGETPKVAFGTMRVKGKDMMLTCTDDPPAGAAKKTKDFLSKAVGLKMKVVLLSAEGEVLEETADEADDQDQTVETETQDPNAEKWQKLFAKLEPLVNKAAASGRGDPSKLRAVWNYAVGIAAEGDFAGAIKVLPKVDQLIKLAAESQPEAPSGDMSKAEKAWNISRPQVVKLYEAVMKTDPENRSTLQAAWAMAQEKAEGKDFEAAIKVTKVLVPKLQALQPKPGQGGDQTSDTQDPSSSEEPEQKKNIVRFQQAMLLWETCRAQMQSEMKKLEQAIVAACKGNDDLDEVADEAQELVERLEVFDERLQDTLNDVMSTDYGPKRDRLKQMAKKQIGEYAAALQDGFFKDVDANNGFVNVAIASTARASLQKIAKELG